MPYSQSLKRLSKADGFSMIEFLVVAAILAIVIVAYLTFFTQALVFTRKVDDRKIAIQKAISLMEEIRAFVESGSETQVELLDDFDDEGVYNPLLTISKSVTAPSDALSANVALGEGWKYYRLVRVEKLKEEESKDLRQVTVSVFQSPDGKAGGKPLADISGIFRTLAAPMPPTQVMDVYVLAIENIPGWWVNLTTIRPLVENAFGDLESANPGLKFRTHWITRSSYGRNRAYTPQINAEELASDGLDKIYFYPGKITRQGFWYYSPEMMRGQVFVDKERLNFDNRADDEDLQGYALADQYNSAMRYFDEKTIYEKRHRAGLDAEPSLRLLLDDMYEHPEKFRNALVMNLHGELLPLPPVRNYSDAARSPIKNPGVRVVTHPERLSVESHEPVRLRVYAYVTDPDAVPAGTVIEDGVSILLRGIRERGAIRVERISGGGNQPYDSETYDGDKFGKLTDEGLVLRFKDFPVRQGSNGGRGLAKSDRLYGLEYIPSPVEDAADFSVNLMSSGDRPKNTARVIITIPSSALPKAGVLTIETRIGRKNLDTGTKTYDPENLSRTYVWIGEDPPLSERYQYQGDPRHCPYADVKTKQRYNWYFKKISEGSGYEGYSESQDGWTEDRIDVDLPRFYEMLRDPLMRSQAVFTTMTGFSFYYIGLGGEIGSDRPNGFPDGLPVNGKLFGEHGTKMVRSITDGLDNVMAEDGSWYAIPWIGELYPDSHYKSWQLEGNLAGGKKNGQFVRKPWSEMPGSGKTFDRLRRTNMWGSASFFNSVGNKSGPFNHVFSAKNMAVATADGTILESIFNFPIQEELKAIRPFELDFGDNYPPEWDHAQYIAARNQSYVLKTFYSATQPTKARSSALVQLISSDNHHGGFFIVNGLSPAGETGTAYIGRYALLTLLQGYLIAGDPRQFLRIPQLPIIRITAPKESADLVKVDSVDMAWEQKWLRWDYQPYAEGYPEGFNESAELFYVVKYSPDDGKTWYRAQDDAQTEAGQYPTEDEQKISGNAYTWNLQNKSGNYILRVEAFRKELPLHYAFHQIIVSVKK